MKVGDKVKVKKIKAGSFSGSCLFTSEMTKFWGKVVTITEITRGNYVKLSGPWGIRGYSFKTDWLEVEKPEDFFSDKDFEI